MADVRACGAQRVVGAEHVHGECSLHHLGVAADDRQLRCDPGVRHDDIEAAHVPDGARDSIVDLVALAHVATGPEAAAGTRGDTLEEILLQADHGDLRALSAQPFRKSSADSARSTSDEYPSHTGSTDDLQRNLRPRSSLSRGPTPPASGTRVASWRRSPCGCVWISAWRSSPPYRR